MKITKEQLKSIRDAAHDEFTSLGQTKGLLPLLYGIIFNKLVEDSAIYFQIELSGKFRTILFISARLCLKLTRIPFRENQDQGSCSLQKWRHLFYR